MEIVYDKPVGHAEVTMGLYVDKAASDSGKDPIDQIQIKIEIGDIDPTKDVRESAYEAIKQLEAWQDAQDA